MSVGARLSALHVQLFDRSSPMTKPISPLRQRMLDDMTFRNMSPKRAAADFRSH